MTRSPKLTSLSIPRWVSSYLADNRKTLLWPKGLFSTAENPRFYRTKRMVGTDDFGNLDKFSLETIKAAQAALLDYLHSTRNLQFSDAEHISKNSPYFLGKLLEKVDSKGKSERSVARYLRFHPINEFELFFESLGLKPCEYNPFLPRGLLFLSDDNLLLGNYHVLCNYGVARNMIGKIHKDALDVFQYDNGVLAMKIRAYEELGLSKSFVSKVIVASPCLLIGDVNEYFTKVLKVLERKGIKLSCIEKHLSEKSSYDWNRLLVLLNLFENIGCTQEQLARLISQHPGILFEGSGNQTLALIGFLFKLGCTMSQIHSMFLQFPKMEVRKFVANLSRCFMFLNEIEMELHEIGKIVCSYPLLLGSCKLKKTSSLLTLLSVGKRRLCEVIQQNPQEIKKWVVGSRVEPLPNSVEEIASKESKTKFLLDLGFVESLDNIEKELKLFRGRGTEFQERFDCMVKAGLDAKEVCEMIRARPQILQQKKHVIEMKINFLLNDLGYPLSSLAKFPAYLCCNIDTVKLRFAIYNFLIDQGKAAPMLSLSTILTCSDKIFVSRYVNSHPSGPGIWQDLKSKLNSSD